MIAPTRIAAALRLIAARLDSSQKPSVARVRGDLRHVLAALNLDVREERIQKIAQDILNLAKDDQSVRLWRNTNVSRENVLATNLTSIPDLESSISDIQSDVDSFLAKLPR